MKQYQKYYLFYIAIDLLMASDGWMANKDKAKDDNIKAYDKTQN